MSLSLGDMRTLLREGLGGLDSQDLPDAEADRFLNMALWSIEDKFDFHSKENLSQFSLVVDQYQYSLPSTLDAVASVAVITADGQKRQKLDRTTRGWLDDNFDQDDDTGTPERYLREGNTLIVHPVPDDDLDCEITFKESVASLAAQADVPDLPRNWHEIVVEEAVVRGHFYAQDYNLAQMAANFSVGHQRQAVLDKNKEEEDSRHAGLEVRRDGKTNWK